MWPECSCVPTVCISTVVKRGHYITALEAWTVFKEILCEPEGDTTQYKNQRCNSHTPRQVWGLYNAQLPLISN